MVTEKGKKPKIYYADLWGLREEKYKYLFENDVQTTKWQELKPGAPYYFLVPKDFALQAEYEKFWKVTEIFKEWSSGVKTHRDHFVVGFTKEEIAQRLRVFTGKLPDELVAQSLNLKDTGTWKLAEARQKIKGQRVEEKMHPFAYRPFDMRFICFESTFIDRPRLPFMNNLLSENLGLASVRMLSKLPFSHAFISECLTNGELVSTGTKERAYIFPLYVYPQKAQGQFFDKEGVIRELPLQEKIKTERIPNFTAEFLQAFSAKIGTPVGAGLVPAQKERATTRVAPTPEEIFYYIYAVLYSPTYRKRYEEFLKIDFPRVPMPLNYDVFKELSNLGKELVELHLLKHPSLDKTETGFPISGSNKVEKIVFDEENWKVFLNKDQYFEGIPKEVWKYRIGAYQVMEKYLKDRKGRKLSLDEINHYMKVAKAIRLTIELQERIDDVYRKIEI
jgi:predicted helicase